MLLAARIARAIAHHAAVRRLDETVTYQVDTTVSAAGSLAYDLPKGTSVTLPISVTVAGPQPLAVASVLVQYDPTVLRPTSCVGGRPRPLASATPTTIRKMGSSASTSCPSPA